MMHLQFPRKRDFYTWEELSCLSRALGFPSETIQNCIPDEQQDKQDGISLKAILKLIDLKYFNDALDRSINMHTADYNINTLLQGLKLLNHRLLSFSELNDVRVAFQVYEAGDMRGMIIDTHTQLRALKLCDRTIAPMKLMHRIKHMQEGFDEPGRIQLHEFLELIVLCELTKDVDVPESKHGTLDKTWRRLFELDNFQEVCITKDEKVEQHLNKQFKNTELNYGHEQLSSKRIPKDSAVDTSRRIEQVRHHNRRYKELHGFMGQSTAQVQRTRAGHIRVRPVTAPEIDEFRLLPPDSPLHSVAIQRPHTVSDFQSGVSAVSASPRTPSRPKSAPQPALSQCSGGPHKYFSRAESTMPEDPRIRLLQALHERRTLRSLTPYSNAGSERGCLGDGQPSTAGSERPWRRMVNTFVQPQTPRVVSEQDVAERQHVLNGLQYQIETLEERTLQKIEQQMKKHLPHYYQRRKDVNETLGETPPPPQPKKKTKKKKSKGLPPESIERLVHPAARQYHDAHDKNCRLQAREFDVPRSSRLSPRKEGRKEERKGGETAKPQLYLDGRRLSVGSDKNLETASTMSSLGDSSVARTTDIGCGSLPQFSAASHRHHAPPPPPPPLHPLPQARPYDPGKFRAAQVGSAATLHDYLNDVRSEEPGEAEAPSALEQTAEGNAVDGAASAEHAPAADGRRHQRPAGVPPHSQRAQPRPAKKTAPDPRLNRWEKARIMRKVTLLEEEELKINGVSLSEIDRLTFKGDEEHVSDLRAWTRMNNQDLYEK